MGFFGGLFKGVVNVALLPVAVVADATGIVAGQDPRRYRSNTADQLESIARNADEVITGETPRRRR